MRRLALGFILLFPTLLTAGQELVSIDCSKNDLVLSVQYYDNRKPEFKLARLAVRQQKSGEFSKVVLSEESSNVDKCTQLNSGTAVAISCSGNIQVDLQNNTTQTTVKIVGFAGFENFDEIFALGECKMQRTLIAEDNGKAWRR